MALSADIIARLRLNASNFSNELRSELSQAERRFGNSGSVIGRNLAEGIGGGLQDAAARVPVLGGAIGGLSGPALAAAASVGAIATALSLGLSEAESFQQEVRRLDAVLQATGRSNSISQRQLVGYAEEMEGAWAIAGEEILRAQGSLVTFENIGADQFNRAIDAAADLSAVFGGDLTTNAQNVGMALQNLGDGNVEGLSRGFRFLGTETLDAIRALAEMGETAEAQERLLQALEQRIGGSAEAGGRGLTASVFRLKDAIGDTAREFVESTGIYQGVIDQVDGLTASFENLTAAMQGSADIDPNSPLFRLIMAMGTGGLDRLIPRPGGQSGEDARLGDTLRQQALDAAALLQSAGIGRSWREQMAFRGEGSRALSLDTNRSAQQAFRDFQRELARRGVQQAAGRTGFRTAEDQHALFQQGLTPLDGYRRASRHQTWQALDPTRASHNEQRAREAAAAAGLTGFRIVRESGGRFHYQWSGHGRPGDPTAAVEETEREQERAAREAEQRAEQAERRRQQEEESRRRILSAMERQSEEEAEALRIAGLRAEGLDQEADLEEALFRVRQQAADRLAQMPESMRDAQRAVTPELAEQLQIFDQQAQEYAGLVEAAGDHEKLTEDERAALAAAREEMAAALGVAKDTGVTIADNLAIDEARVRANQGIAAAIERGSEAEAERNALIDKELEAEREAQRQLEEMKEEAYRREQETIQDLADLYETLFTDGIDGLWEEFERAGLRAIAEIAAQWTLAMMTGQRFDAGAAFANMVGSGRLGPVGSILGGLFGGSGGASGKPGASLGQIMPLPSGFPAGAGGMGGIGGMGGVLAGIGQALPQIGMAMAATSLISDVFGIKNHAGGLFGIGGNLLINAITPAKRGSATLGVSDGEFGLGSSRGNSGKRVEAATSAIGAVGDMLNRIAEALGGDVMGAGSVSIGLRGKNWRVDPTGQGRTKTKRGAIDFGEDQEAAIRYAVAEALRDGVIGGISDASKRILAAGKDLEKQIAKAAMIEEIPKLLKARLDPVGAALDELEERWEKVTAALKEGGASAEQMAEAQKLYKLELDETLASTSSASQGLKDFLDSLKMGPDSPYSLRQQEEMAKTALQPFLDKIGAGEAIDQDAYQAAAQTFLDIERQIYGSTGSFFQAMDQVMAATGKAIERIDSAVPIRTAADPFAEATANHTQIMTEQLDQMNGLLLGILNGMSGGGGGGFIGSGRGFVGRMAHS